jgi:TRAP-type uncharacterized transport system substrate-binding protein
MSRDKDPNHFMMYNGSDATLATAWLAIRQFEGMEPITDLRFLNAFDFGHHALVTLDPNIKTMEDFDGKSIAIMPGSDGRHWHETSFEVLGVDVEVVSMGFSEQYEALRDGLVDGCQLLGNGPPGTAYKPVPPLFELIQLKDVYVVPFPHELSRQVEPLILEKYGYPIQHGLSIWLPGTIPTQTEAIEVYDDVVLGYAVKAGMDDDLAYELTETMVDHYYRFGDIMPQLKTLTPALMVQMLPLTAHEDYARKVGRSDEITLSIEELIHPGALRYYKEYGLWPQAWDRRGEVITLD